MKYTKKHSFALLFAALLVASSLTACGETEMPETDAVSTETIAAETEPETTDIDLLPDANYEGFDFHILSTDPDCLWGWMVSIYAEEENGEPLNDAVFQRNTAIEERYNITISNTAEMDSGPTSTEAKTLALAGDDVYSIMSYGVKWQLVDAMTGCFLNLHSIDSIDFSHPWWNGGAADLLTIQDKVYMGFSEMNTFDNEALPGIFVNFDLIENNALESPYDLVRDGTWTMDKIYDMAAVAVQDLDGDGLASEADVIGFVGGIGSFNAMLLATDQPHIRIGEDGRYILNHGTEGSIAAAEKIARLVNDKVISAYQNDQSWSGSTFKNEKALFHQGTLSYLSQLREYDFNMGIVPLPKFDENQEEYYSMYSNQSMTIAIPKSNSDPERTGVICEALGAYSRIPLREVYFESMLKRKAARDEETAEMLDIIVESKFVEVGALHENSMGNVISPYFNAIRSSGSEQLASTAASTRKAFENALTKLEETYAGLE